MKYSRIWENGTRKLTTKLFLGPLWHASGQKHRTTELSHTRIMAEKGTLFKFLEAWTKINKEVTSVILFEIFFRKFNLLWFSRSSQKMIEVERQTTTILLIPKWVVIPHHLPNLRAHIYSNKQQNIKFANHLAFQNTCNLFY